MKNLSISVLLLLVLIIGCNKKNPQPEQEEVFIATEPEKPIEVQSGKVNHINNSDFRLLIHDYQNSKEWNFKGSKPAIVNFYADWCAPCRKIAPIFEELAYEYADYITIYKVNVDYEPELARTFNVQSIPTKIYIPINAEPVVQVGVYTKQEYKQMIEKTLIKNK